MIEKEKEFILSIKNTLEFVYDGWESYYFTMFLQDAEDYLGVAGKKIENPKDQILCWQIAINIIYHLMVNNIMQFDREPNEIAQLNEKEKIKWRVSQIQQYLASCNPYEDVFAEWYSYHDLTSTGKIFMSSSVNANDEIDDERFLHNFIKYFEIRNLKEWIENPVIQVGNL